MDDPEIRPYSSVLCRPFRPKAFRGSGTSGGAPSGGKNASLISERLKAPVPSPVEIRVYTCSEIAKIHDMTSGISARCCHSLLMGHDVSENVIAHLEMRELGCGESTIPQGHLPRELGDSNRSEQRPNKQCRHDLRVWHAFNSSLLIPTLL